MTSLAGQLDVFWMPGDFYDEFSHRLVNSIATVLFQEWCQAVIELVLGNRLVPDGAYQICHVGLKRDA